MEVIITKNYQEMSQLAGIILAKEIAKKKKLVLGLPTGQTPLGLYRFLVKAYQQDKISFKKIITFNLDEYISLGPADKESYYFYMKRNFFNFIDIRAKNIFMLNGKAKNLKQECQSFERKIKKQGGLDLVILGLGKNDHIGFNEPGSAFNSKTRVVKLSSATRRANTKFFRNKRVPKQAITMGLTTIIKAKKIILLASGKDKAWAVKKALEAPISSQVPASVLRQHPRAIFIFDQAAASKLKNNI